MGKSKDHHADGQHDGAKSGTGNANPPHGHAKEFGSFGENLKQVHQDNKEYWDGFNNAQKQKK